jgi:hypothetical protein
VCEKKKWAKKNVLCGKKEKMTIFFWPELWILVSPWRQFSRKKFHPYHNVTLFHPKSLIMFAGDEKNSQKQNISIFLKDNSKSVLSKQKVKWNRVYHASFLKYKILFGMRISFGMEILRKGPLALTFFKTRKGTTQTKHVCNLPFAEIFGPVLSPDSAFFFLFWRAWMEDPFKQLSAWYQIRPKPPSEQTKKCSHFFLYYFILKQEKQRCLKTPCSTQLPGQLLVRFFKGNRFSLKFWPNIGGFRLYQNAFHTLHSTLT